MTADNRTNEPKQTKAKRSQDFVFSEAQVEAAGVAFNTFERNYLDLTPLEKHHSRIRAALVAAAGVVPVVQQVSESDALALVEDVIAIHADRIGTHYEDCYKYHVACLAVAVKRRLGGGADDQV